MSRGENSLVAAYQGRGQLKSRPSGTRVVTEDITRLEAFAMWIWRRLEKISWTEHIAYEEVLKLVEEERSLLMTIRKRQRNWVRHIMRGGSLQREIIEEWRVKEEGEEKDKNFLTG